MNFKIKTITTDESMRLQLTRPIVGLDFESTGKDTQAAQICQYAFVKLFPDGSRKHLAGLIKPTIPMPADALAVHGITDEMLQDAPRFVMKANEIHDFIRGCDLVGFNLLIYDVPLLYCELERAGIDWDHLQHDIIDAGNIFKIREPRTLSAAMMLYTGRPHDDAHDALEDVVATLEVLAAQMDKYPELPANVAELAEVSSYGRKRADVGGKFIVNEDGEYVINFGKHRGELARKQLDYIKWMLGGTFPKDAKAICRRVIQEQRTDNIDRTMNAPDPITPAPPAAPVPPRPVPSIPTSR